MARHGIVAAGNGVLAKTLSVIDLPRTEPQIQSLDIPEETILGGKEERNGKIIAFPILIGLQHDYGFRHESSEAAGTNAYEVFG